jgi:hypothetical protein
VKRTQLSSELRIKLNEHTKQTKQQLFKPFQQMVTGPVDEIQIFKIPKSRRTQGMSLPDMKMKTMSYHSL